MSISNQLSGDQEMHHESKGTRDTKSNENENIDKGNVHFFYWLQLTLIKVFRLVKKLLKIVKTKFIFEETQIKSLIFTAKHCISFAIYRKIKIKKTYKKTWLPTIIWKIYRRHQMLQIPPWLSPNDFRGICQKLSARFAIYIMWFVFVVWWDFF